MRKRARFFQRLQMSARPRLFFQSLQMSARSLLRHPSPSNKCYLFTKVEQMLFRACTSGYYWTLVEWQLRGVNLPVPQGGLRAFPGSPVSGILLISPDTPIHSRHPQLRSHFGSSHFGSKVVAAISTALQPAAMWNPFLELGVDASATTEVILRAFAARTTLTVAALRRSVAQMHLLTAARDALVDPATKLFHLEQTRPHPQGNMVQLQGLVGAAGLNGKFGTAGRWNGLRLEVHLPGVGVKAVRPENMTAPAPPDEAQRIEALRQIVEAAHSAPPPPPSWVPPPPPSAPPPPRSTPPPSTLPQPEPAAAEEGGGGLAEVMHGY